ncbi:competence type IV pilus assembly protein ComGB [Metabacillus indicus]|uniref:competence type IV pilus assembly protein ComGB n=1 Tax=Metabacillus indicus TaxID=246786 RepID=UPI00398444E1
MKTKKRWSLKDQSQFLKRMSNLLEKGYTLNEALKFTSIDLRADKSGDVAHCLRRLSAGQSIRSAFEELSFHREVLSYLYFAEKHGDLDAAFKEAGDMLSRKVVQREKWQKVMQYPLFLFFTIGILFYLSQSVIAPQFQQIYHSMNLEPSFLTHFLFFLFEAVKSAVIGSLVLLMLGGVYYMVRLRAFKPQRKMRFMLKIPVWKKIIVLINSYYFALQLSNLLKSGLSIYESLKVFEHQNFLPFYRDEAKWFIEHLKKGERFETLISHNCFYEKEMSQVVGHGQANGRLARELYTYSQFVLERLEDKTMKWLLMIQPAAYITVGITVLIMYLSMIMPMYHMMEAL